MKRARGFTLIEVLVAVGIIALLGVLIYAAFAGMSKSRKNMMGVGDRYQQGRQAMQRIARELSSAYMSGHRNFLRRDIMQQTGLIGHKGRPDSLDFTAFAHQRLAHDKHESDQCEIGYFGARNRDSGGTDLMRRESKFIDQDFTKGGKEEILAEDIDDFDLKYLDPITNEWQQGWDSTQAAGQYGRLPAQVWVVLVLNGGPAGGRIRFEEKITIPIMLPLLFATD